MNVIILWIVTIIYVICISTADAKVFAGIGGGEDNFKLYIGDALTKRYDIEFGYSQGNNGSTSRDTGLVRKNSNGKITTRKVFKNKKAQDKYNRKHTSIIDIRRLSYEAIYLDLTTKTTFSDKFRFTFSTGLNLIKLDTGYDIGDLLSPNVSIGLEAGILDNISLRIRARRIFLNVDNVRDINILSIGITKRF